MTATRLRESNPVPLRAREKGIAVREWLSETRTRRLLERVLWKVVLKPMVCKLGELEYVMDLMDREDPAWSTGVMWSRKSWKVLRQWVMKTTGVGSWSVVSLEDLRPGDMVEFVEEKVRGVILDVTKTPGKVQVRFYNQTENKIDSVSDWFENHTSLTETTIPNLGVFCIRWKLVK